MRDSLQVAQRASSGKIRGGTRYPTQQGGGPHASTLLRQLGCPSEPCQTPGHHVWDPGDSSAHGGYTAKSLHHLVRFYLLSPLDGGHHSYSPAFISLPPLSQQERGAGRKYQVWVLGGGSNQPRGRGFRGMRFSWPCPGELPALPARGQGYFEISVQLMTGGPRT